MKRFLLWLLFAGCIAVAMGAMAWVSAAALRLDRNEAEARRNAVVEENVRLALWRMDSLLSPLIAQETARPYFAYTAFTPAERAYTRMFNEIRYGEVLIPSPLLTHESPMIRLHFQFAPDGTLSSPQVPAGTMRQIAIDQYTTKEQIESAQADMERLKEHVQHGVLLAAVPMEIAPMPMPMAVLSGNSGEQLAENSGQQREQIPANNAAIEQQALRNRQEYAARNQAQVQANNYEFNTLRGNKGSLAQPVRVREGVIKPLWISTARDGKRSESLVLARRVSIDDSDYLQGAWLEWETMRQSLLDGVRDLLPEARLEPVLSDDGGADEKQPLRLAALPVRLVPGNVPGVVAEAQSPLRLTLTVAWGALLLGSGAVALLLWGALRLSERRGAFVSAVTHELRTPLTTVSMYAEMLEGGMVPDEARRQMYLATLRAEADRLGHLVENVLAYSRIERSNIEARLVDVPLSRLIEDTRGRLEQRAGQAGMELVVSVDDAAAGLSVRADPSAIEQILFNLVDNAAKYAKGAGDRRIELHAFGAARMGMIEVRDHGPGIAEAEARKLFRPFSKSAREAAQTAPGVGLGLALSKRLARQMRGDLTLQKMDGYGAVFRLVLPLV